MMFLRYWMTYQDNKLMKIIQTAGSISFLYDDSSISLSFYDNDSHIVPTLLAFGTVNQFTTNYKLYKNSKYCLGSN